MISGRYLTKISVYDKSEQAAFVILGDAGKELSGKHDAELVATYYEVISYLIIHRMHVCVTANHHLFMYSERK